MPMQQRISFILLLTTILTGCTSLPEKVTHVTDPVISQPNSTLSELIDTYRPEHSAKMSAYLLQESGWDALSQRLALVETAKHSIDIQYYIWNNDTSGLYLASRLLVAANRGVRVRVMLDDFNLNERDDLLVSFDNHPNIEIRLFNPVPTRSGLMRWLNMGSDFSRLNRRMHNKSFTVDGAMSVVGGRNIGDEYFDLSDEINFRDRDVLVAGPVVAEIQASFSEYWNSTWSYPVNLLSDTTSIDLATLENIKPPHYQHYPDLPEGSKIANQLLNDLMGELSWGHAYFVSDRPVPEDANETNEPKATARLLSELAQQAKQEILLESAYLIFDDRQLTALQKLTDKGVQIKALTNSMASNDLLPNHSGYAGRRHDMLENGVQLFELKPETILCEKSTRDPSKCAPTASYGLHAKSAVYDRKIATIGSFNFNLRSTYLNTESVLVIENQEIAQHLVEAMEEAINEDNSWRLSLHEDQVRWYSGEKSWESEPETGQWERIKSHFLQLLPIEKYL
ncbi:phospholipase D family protein [Psychromonas marina]|uniref:Phospholipase D family protein n=1 Tax=Psychromonas marina TaxID=88364 RepID=A0ABQ6E1H4_9GAMM|nr:phospholipase D family protein [Psychromonas marina]GLS91055.1 phospholipase D family protein [Psychromonas marina]